MIEKRISNEKEAFECPPQSTTMIRSSAMVPAVFSDQVANKSQLKMEQISDKNSATKSICFKLIFLDFISLFLFKLLNYY